MSIENAKVIRVNLTNKEILIEDIDQIICRKYLGGSALASYFLLNELQPGVDPLGEENVLVFSCSVVTGVPIPGLSRYTVAAKSPLTGGFGEAEAGGWWAPELKKAGYIAVVIKGSAENPVYLWINDDNVELKDAGHLRGKDTGEAERIIRQELGDEKIIFAQTGPAGENLVRYACVVNNVKHVNGRTGMGAVMGAKNLRGIAVRSKKTVPVADKEKVREITKWFAANWKASSQGMFEYGTAGGVEPLNTASMLPTNNFNYGRFTGAKNISADYMNENLLHRREGCYACPVRCKRVVQSESYSVDPYFGGPEYETISALGSLCGIDNLEAIAKGNELCNKYALDTISTGVTIAFAMECYEQNIITDTDTDGIELKFGNEKAMLEIIELIARKEGIGSILGEGVARAAKHFGPKAEKYAMHIKGQELPLHDPRGKIGVGMGYAVSPTGADHLEAHHDEMYADYGQVLENVYPLGILEPIGTVEISNKKVRQFSYLQKLWSLYNSLGICNFTAVPKFTLTLDKIVELTTAITGWQTSLWELLKVGERANVMARCFNIREGFTDEQDTLPDRLFEPQINKENMALEGIDREEFRNAIKKYYEMEGWNEKGIPTRAKLIELCLEWIDF